MRSGIKRAMMKLKFQAVFHGGCFVENLLFIFQAKPDYKFAYGVSDPNTGNSQKHQESRDGDTVKGEYSLIEPDGYIRRVIYSADSKHGFQATVIYEPPAGAISSSPKASSNIFPKPAKLTDDFPYEQIMNSIPDVHDIPIPHYDNVEAPPNAQYNSEGGRNYDRDEEGYDSPGHYQDDGNLYDSSNLVRSNANLLEPRFYEDTTSVQGLQEGEGISSYPSGIKENVRREALEELPLNRAYDSAEVTSINNMYEPEAETSSAEYETFT